MKPFVVLTCGEQAAQRAPKGKPFTDVVVHILAHRRVSSGHLLLVAPLDGGEPVLRFVRSTVDGARHLMVGSGNHPLRFVHGPSGRVSRVEWYGLLCSGHFVDVPLLDPVEFGYSPSTHW